MLAEVGAKEVGTFLRLNRKLKELNLFKLRDVSAGKNVAIIGERCPENSPVLLITSHIITQLASKLGEPFSFLQRKWKHS